MAKNEPVVLELASLPREQMGAFLILGLDKAASKKDVDEHWAERVKWARRSIIKVPLEDINWARDVLGDPDKRVKSDAASLNADSADGLVTGLAQRYDMLSPPVLDLLEAIGSAARLAGVEVSVCGEHAARPLEAMVLAALGITTLSMPAASLLRTKSVLAGVDLQGLRAMLAAARAHAGSAASLRGPIVSWAREHGLDV